MRQTAINMASRYGQFRVVNRQDLVGDTLRRFPSRRDSDIEILEWDPPSGLERVLPDGQFFSLAIVRCPSGRWFYPVPGPTTYLARAFFCGLELMAATERWLPAKLNDGRLRWLHYQRLIRGQSNLRRAFAYSKDFRVTRSGRAAGGGPTVFPEDLKRALDERRGRDSRYNYLVRLGRQQRGQIEDFECHVETAVGRGMYVLAEELAGAVMPLSSEDMRARVHHSLFATSTDDPDCDHDWLLREVHARFATCFEKFVWKEVEGIEDRMSRWESGKCSLASQLAGLKNRHTGRSRSLMSGGPSPNSAGRQRPSLRSAWT